MPPVLRSESNLAGACVTAVSVGRRLQ